MIGMLREPPDIERIDLGHSNRFGEDMLRLQILNIEGDLWVELRMIRRVQPTGELAPTENGLLVPERQLDQVLAMLADAQLWFEEVNERRASPSPNR
jgi:hypothetical protein